MTNKLSHQTLPLWLCSTTIWAKVISLLVTSSARWTLKSGSKDCYQINLFINPDAVQLTSFNLSACKPFYEDTSYWCEKLEKHKTIEIIPVCSYQEKYGLKENKLGHSKNINTNSMKIFRTVILCVLNKTNNPNVRLQITLKLIKSWWIKMWHWCRRKETIITVSLCLYSIYMVIVLIIFTVRRKLAD